VLVFEDAPSGVAAALAAGMAVVMVPDANLDAGLVSKLGATAVLGSLCEFLPMAERWGLPPFGGAGGGQQLPN
jgi:pseudouridine-5'-monophosphatase